MTSAVPRPPVPLRPYRVVIIDDIPLLVDLLANQLNGCVESPRFDVVGRATRIADLPALLRGQPVDLALVDHELPDGHGEEAFALLRRGWPRVRGLLFSQYPEEELARRAARMHFDGFLSKDASAEELLVALRDVMAGRPHFSAAIMRGLLVDVLAGADRDEPQRRLSVREREALQALFDHGEPSRAAAALGVTEATLRSHLAGAIHKLGARDRVSALSIALRHGLVMRRVT